jgi:lipopolysaccharide/colanic/teichoic acid biosynthesis glycosyltransferase
LSDYKNPFYLAPRVGKESRLFTMIKLRSMSAKKVGKGFNSTSDNDIRITKIGRTLRRYKLDELPQLVNILKGEMSFVGPRPNVEAEVMFYSTEEKKILSVVPGITDFASVVFSNEGEILKNSTDPDLDYRVKIWPLKSELAIFYVDNRSVLVDVKLCFATLLSPISRKRAILNVIKTLEHCEAPTVLVDRVRKTLTLQDY